MARVAHAEQSVEKQLLKEGTRLERQSPFFAPETSNSLKGSVIEEVRVRTSS